MALKSPLMPSPTASGVSSTFDPYSDSPSSPSRFSTYPASGTTQSNRSSGQQDSLAPPPSPYPQQIEPSPVDSNGTEGTDIDEDAQEEDTSVRSPKFATRGTSLEIHSPDLEITSPLSAKSDNPPPKLDTRVPAKRSDSPNNDPQSVIHIPSGFKNFERGRTSQGATEQTEAVGRHEKSPSTPEAAAVPAEKKPIDPVNTNVPRSFMDRSTPRAQTRQELDEEHIKRKQQNRRSRTSSLEGLLPGFGAYFERYLTRRADIPEALDKEQLEPQARARDVASSVASTSNSSGSATAERDVNSNTDEIEDEAPNTAGLATEGTMKQAMDDAEAGVRSLRTALSECWTLCNTLAALSSNHRQRTFKFSGKTEVQEQAWRSCWRLCQELYEHKDEDNITTQVVPTLELCRDFCQSLFDARQKLDEVSDSVLRVSFELNNHLYNTHDRALPDAFNERTLDFYITMCHRLMKQRTSLPQEIDSLLRACWQLAENLFNLRQASRDGKSVDEELLGSTLQACWDLCDLFREGWTQIRPDRGTPRPNQTGFGSQRTSRSRSDGRSTSSTLSGRKYHEARPSLVPPETPITVFDDTSTAQSSPDDVTVPNILVLGPASTGSNSIRGGVAPHHDRWTSNASVLSDYSESASATSQRSSSTSTTTSSEETQLARLRCLLLKAGVNTGYKRNSGQTLPTYVTALPDSAFGTLPWQMKVLNYYKKLVTNDKSMLSVHQTAQRRLVASEVAKSVRWLGSSEQWAWMRDLFRLVFGFGVDEADRNSGSVAV